MKNVVILISVILLAGCTGLNIDNPLELVFGNNNQTRIQETPLLTAGSQDDDNKNLDCGELSMTSKQDVDTVFASIKYKFNFKSPSELEQQYGKSQANWMIQDISYAYTATPGAFYEMGTNKDIGKAEQVTLRIAIIKQGGGTIINIKFSTFKGDGKLAQQEIKKAINAALE